MLLNNAYGRYIVDRAKQLQALDIWHTAQCRQIGTAELQIFAKWGWPTSRSRDPYKILHTLKHISKMRKATDLKFGKRMHINNYSKMDK